MKIFCEPCNGSGRFLTECCNGAGGCSCRGKTVDMGNCRVCGGSGMRHENANTRANIESISGLCFVGSGPKDGFWCGR